MDLVIWFVRSFVENAFSVALVGFAYGPFFVGNMGQAHQTLPTEFRMITMAVMYANPVSMMH